MRNAFILSIIVVLFCTPEVWADLPEFPICIQGSNQSSPAVSDNIVVWVDYRNGSYDIYGYDVSSQTEFAICTESNSQVDPAIDVNIVVWEDRRSGNWDIYGYNLSTQTEFAICTRGGDQYSPSISGNIVVWNDTRHGNYDIYGYNLLTQTEFPVCTNYADQFSPAIDGNIVVWSDHRNSDADIYGYDLNRQYTFSICKQTRDQSNPIIHGDIVVWDDHRNHSYYEDIYGYNLSTRTDYAVCTQSNFQLYPAVSGDIVVWQDQRSGENIYGYDISTQTEFLVSTERDEQRSPAISGGLIVWADNRNNNWDIYGAFIDPRHQSSSNTCQDAPYVIDNEPFYGSNFYASGTDVSGCAYNDTIDVWNRYIPSRGGTVTISTEGSSFDTVLSVFEACGSVELACNDDYGLYNPHSRIVMDVVKGKTYYIRVAGFNGEVGDYDLLITQGECSDPPQSDLNGDCKVNLIDLSMLAEEWLVCGKADPKDC